MGLVLVLVLVSLHPLVVGGIFSLAVGAYI